MIQQRKCRKKQCHIWDESPLVGNADQMVFICTFIAMYVFIGHVCWKRKRDEDAERSSCARGTLFFGGNEELIGRMQANVAGKDELENPRGQIWPSPKRVRRHRHIFKIKSAPPRAFLNVFHSISKGGKNTHIIPGGWESAHRCCGGGSHHPRCLNNLKGSKDFQSLRHQSYSNTTTHTGNLNRHKI